MNSHDWMALAVQLLMVCASFFGGHHGAKKGSSVE